jgi:hypothetical protein
MHLFKQNLENQEIAKFHNLNKVEASVNQISK